MKNEYIKSPLNYTGGKFKLLPQILPLFPSKISMFYDIFGGGGSISLNADANHIYYNDIVNYIGDMFSDLQDETIESALNKMNKVVSIYNLSKTNLEGFIKLRDDYNRGDKSWQMFYILMCYSFNNQYRFNNKHEYNSSFGKHKSCYSSVTEEKFKIFLERLQKLDIVFDNKDFREIDFSDADENDLVYCDPPYLINSAVYQDGKRGFKGWNQQDDIDLYNLLDGLNENGVRFALSNVLESKGSSNDILKDWAKKYNVNYLDYTYSNSNYQKKDKKSKDLEVLITNYK